MQYEDTMILQRFFSLFKRNTHENPTPTNSPTPNKQVGGAGSYKPELVATLKDDHQILFNIVGRIQKAVDNKNWSTVTKELQIFREKIYAHLLIENIDLYIYLQRSLADDPVNLKMMRELQKEMSGISTAVVNFLSKYKTLEKEANLQEEFPSEFNDVCDVLVRRIECEERVLYPMYVSVS